MGFRVNGSNLNVIILIIPQSNHIIFCPYVLESIANICTFTCTLESQTQSWQFISPAGMKPPQVKPHPLMEAPCPPPLKSFSRTVLVATTGWTQYLDLYYLINGN